MFVEKITKKEMKNVFKVSIMLLISNMCIIVNERCLTDSFGFQLMTGE